MKLHTLAIAALAGLTCANCGGERASPEPALNLVFVVLDTLRPDRLGCYGYERPTSPHLDRLASGAAVFENAQTTAPWTAPAMISMVTGLYPAVHGVHPFPNPGRLNEGVTTLAGVLAARGWRTLAITEGGYASAEFGLDLGFEDFRSTTERGAARFPNRRILRENVESAVGWLGLHRDEPNFLFLHTYEPHAPYRAPPEYGALVRPEWDGAAEHALLRGAIENWNEHGKLERESMRLLARHSLACGCLGTTLPTIKRERQLWEQARQLGVDRVAMLLEQETRSWVSDQYDAEIAYADAELAPLWQALDDLQLSQRTIVVVISDHGESLGEKGHMGHGHSLSQELIRMVLLMRVPGQDFGPRRVGEVVSAVDVMPTVLDLMGIDPGQFPLQGRSLRHLLVEGGRLEGEVSQDRPAFSHARNIAGEENRFLSVRVGPWRYVADRGQGSAALFDVNADPLELRDLAAERPDVMTRLSELLDQQAQQDDSLREALSAEREQVELDPALLQELRKLGYLGQD